MTRFARAKGSKSSNERLPEEATSWETMKKALKNTQKEKAEKKHREAMNKIRQENYQNFLEECETKKKAVWAEFPNGQSTTLPLKNEKKLKRLQKATTRAAKLQVTKDAEERTTSSNQCNNSYKASDSTKFENMSKPENASGKTKKRKKTKNKQLDESIDNTSKEHAGIEDNNISDKPIVNEEHSYKKQLKKLKKKRLQLSTENISEADAGAEDNDNSATPSTNKKRSKKRKMKKSTEDTSKTENSTEETNSATPSTNKKRSKKGKMKESAEDTSKTENSTDETKPKQNQNANQGKKRKIAKIRDNKEHKRRKPEPIEPEKISINGKEEEIVKFDGFPVTKTDFNRLVQLRKKLKSNGIPYSTLNILMQSERRRAEKYLARNRKKHCFNCRQGGHLLAECPKLQEEAVQTAGTDICFKCGSTEHTSMKCNVKADSFKFAQCFICKEQGHIARQCPDNPRGLYPDGGACKLCGDVTHFKKDCPQNQERSEESGAFLNTITDNNLEGLDEEVKTKKESKTHTQKHKIIKF